MVRTIRIVMSGRVQGVGFRAWIERRARELGLAGWVRNLRDGTVEALFHGDDDAVHDMIAHCRRGPARASVEVLERYEESEPPRPGFLIRSSE
ncbi:MAG: acylphosphatase [Phyllobacteriaceae bacterium]|nr:acylphosphatase [Phyllobacteriaceae bacterium]